jgi:hypothetical protein
MTLKLEDQLYINRETIRIFMKVLGGGRALQNLSLSVCLCLSVSDACYVTNNLILDFIHLIALGEEFKLLLLPFS